MRSSESRGEKMSERSVLDCIERRRARRTKLVSESVDEGDS